MRSLLPLIIATALLSGCGGAPPESKQEASAPAPKPRTMPAPEDRRFPVEGRIEVVQSAGPLYGKAFLTGGNVARYKKGTKPFELFLIRVPAPGDPGMMLFDYKNVLANAKFVAHFGGYAGQDEGVNVFIFTKGEWLAGVRGLPLAEADAISREFAARLN